MEGLARSGTGLEAMRAGTIERPVWPDRHEGRRNEQRIASRFALDDEHLEAAGEPAVQVAPLGEGGASPELHRSTVAADTKRRPTQRPLVQLPDVYVYWVSGGRGGRQNQQPYQESNNDASSAPPTRVDAFHRLSPDKRLTAPFAFATTMSHRRV